MLAMAKHQSYECHECNNVLFYIKSVFFWHMNWKEESQKTGKSRNNPLSTFGATGADTFDFFDLKPEGQANHIYMNKSAIFKACQYSP